MQSVLNNLTSRASDLSVFVVRRHGVENTHRDIIVRQHRMLQDVLWLTTNNSYFKVVEIDGEAINCLAENGPRFVLDTEATPHEHEDEGPPQEHTVIYF